MCSKNIEFMPDTNDTTLNTPVAEPMVDLDKRPPVEVTEAQKEQFFKAFLADRLYEEEFNLLGGNFRVRLKAFSMRENADLLTQIAYDRDKGKIEGVNDYYFARVAHYRLGLALVSINDVPFCPELTPDKVPFDKAKGESYVSKRADTFSDWPMVKMAALQAALQTFDQRILVLVDAVAKSDFWKAAA